MLGRAMLTMDPSRVAMNVPIDTAESTSQRRSTNRTVLLPAGAHGRATLAASPALVAANKAWTAARERRPTRAIGRAVSDRETGFDIAYQGDARYVGWGGGLLVMIDGTVVGSVAVSGPPELEDMELAGMGVAAITGQK
jgi:uncharacterized protein GlcG (DUF336 family)